MTKYRIYIDEVGNSDLGSSDNPNHRFLSLTGVILELDHVEHCVHPQMEALKEKFFRSHPDDPVIFHRKDMLNARPPFEALKDGKTRREFDQELLNLLAKWQYTAITVCLDKKKHQETYTTWRYDPYHYCLAVLLERFAFFLTRESARGDVMAESRGGKDDMRLKKSFVGLWEAGTQYVKPGQFQERFTSKQLKVKTKTNNIAGLQLCDMVAHSSRHEILWENHLIERPPGAFAEKVIGILKQKYDQYKGQIWGWGEKIVVSAKKRPLRARWYTPSTSGKPDYFNYRLSEKKVKCENGRIVQIMGLMANSGHGTVGREGFIKYVLFNLQFPVFNQFYHENSCAWPGQSAG